MHSLELFVSDKKTPLTDFNSEKYLLTHVIKSPKIDGLQTRFELTIQTMSPGDHLPIGSPGPPTTLRPPQELQVATWRQHSKISPLHAFQDN